MATIFAQMCGNTIPARRRDDFRRADRVGMVATARIADGGDVIDIDAEPQHQAA